MTGTVECNMTELARVLLNNFETTLKVSFQKQVKESDVFTLIKDFYFTTLSKDVDKALKPLAKVITNGAERTAVGTHNNKMDAVGRLYFTETTVKRDLGKMYDNRMILISLNHLNWVEVNKVKYILK